MKFLCLVSILSIFILSGFAQKDTGKFENLPEVIINAFERSRLLKDIPAAVNYVGKSTFERFDPVSIVSAVNSTPGVHMEERSPGSFRFNIRGSSLRSPFGVRNVKVYFNDIPVTDPGGITYLNQFGYYNFNSIEIIKGPGNSLYGAGDGGVLLIESMKNESPGLFTEYTTGSYGLQNIYGSFVTGNSANKISFQHQQSDGYRVHSRLRRDVFTWNGNYPINEKMHLKTTFLYGDLFYETPGALTKAEYIFDPKAARPTVGSTAGSETANARVEQKQFIAGASLTLQLSSNLENKTVLYGMFTDFRNPAIQNYGHNSEPHFGGRTVFKYQRQLWRWMLNCTWGGEIQQGFPTVSIYKNNNGNADSLRTFDDINNRQALIFSQISMENKGWILNLSGSLNFQRLKFERFTPASLGKQQKTFNDQLAPRFSILKKLNNLNIYTSISKGFSPPSTAELLPTGGAINLDLDAEHGINYDAGIKGTFGKLFIDINAFIFSLQNTIVQRRTASGGDYYINAGNTNQHGIETYISHPLFKSKFFERSVFWLSHTWHDFHYKEFKQLTTDYSGNQLPATPAHTISSGFDFLAKNGLLGTISYYYSSKIPLNDANSEFADPYHLVGLKLGYAIKMKHTDIKLFAGVDNLLDQKYSLGNDINAFGGRYFNAAARRNYYGGIALMLNAKEHQ